MYDYKKLSEAMELALKVQKQMPSNINKVAYETGTIINSLSKSGALELLRQVARQYKSFESQIKVLSQLQPILDSLPNIDRVLKENKTLNTVFTKKSRLYC